MAPEMSISYQRRVVFLSLVFTLMACENEDQRRHDKAIAHINARRDSIAREAKPALAVNPCSRPRPYKNWSNEELNIAQVEYMGTPQSLELIREAGCRTR